MEGKKIIAILFAVIAAPILVLAILCALFISIPFLYAGLLIIAVIAIILISIKICYITYRFIAGKKQDPKSKDYSIDQIKEIK